MTPHNASPPQCGGPRQPPAASFKCVLLSSTRWRRAKGGQLCRPERQRYGQRSPGPELASHSACDGFWTSSRQLEHSPTSTLHQKPAFADRAGAWAMERRPGGNQARCPARGQSGKRNPRTQSGKRTPSLHAGGRHAPVAPSRVVGLGSAGGAVRSARIPPGASTAPDAAGRGIRLDDKRRARALDEGCCQVVGFVVGDRRCRRRGVRRTFVLQLDAHIANARLLGVPERLLLAVVVAADGSPWRHDLAPRQDIAEA
eukprot:1406893-Rhodomonas_salina.2